MRQWLYAGLLSIWSLSASAGDLLPRAIQQALRLNHIPAEALSIYMAPAYGGKPYWVYRADMPMSPASTMKLVTSYAALELLGPAYRWRTDLASTAPVKEGVLQGDLYLKGSGDPKLTVENIYLMLKALRDQGIQEINGDLILDRTWFIPPQEAAFDTTPELAYNVAPEAMIFNFNAVKVTAQSDNRQVRMKVEPPLSLIHLENDLMVSSQESCANGDSLPRPVMTEMVAGSVNVQFVGKFPAHCTGSRYYQLIDTSRYIGSFFALTWQSLGGIWQGRVREAPVPAAAHILYTHYSPDLVNVIRDVNKFSNNTMARLVYLTLGADQQASLQTSQNRLLRWLQRKGLSTASFVVENGSGLSRKEQISAALLGQLLRAAMRSPYASELESSLPIVGIDGTMKNRLVGHNIAGYAHIKTGTLTGVRAIAGTLTGADGKKAVIVAMINQPDTEVGAEVLDAVLTHAWEMIDQSPECGAPC
jgi:D-alanyl-D-alanine carboxypeptidase/D-alanyl-D-alanine-endopeptidase (penicillin-binding protein 4)